MNATPRSLAGRAGLLLAFLLTGCPAPKTPLRSVTHEGQAIPFERADELLRRISEVNDGYGTLSTVHKVTAEIALGGNRSEKRTFRGALALRRPRNFRLQILGPMGVKLADLLYDGGKTRVLHMDRNLQRASRLPQIIESIAGDIRAIYRLDPLPHCTRRKLEASVSFASGAAPLYDLKEYRGEEIVRQLDVFAATLAIARSQVVDEKADVRTVTYGGYESDGKLMVPKTIHVAKEGTVFYWLSIQVESVTIDEELDDELFVVK